MSAQNHPLVKRSRRLIRATRKALAVRRIPNHGVVVSRKDVIGHRYLAVKGKEFSRSVAAVQIEANSGKGAQS